MKTRLAVVLLVAAAVLIAAFALTRMLRARCGMEPFDRLRDITSLSRTLALTPAQAEQAAALHKSYAGQMDECCARHCAARYALGNEMLKTNPDSEKVRAMIEQMARAQTDSDMATVRHISRLREILTQEQSEKLGRIVNSMLLGACPMNSHSALDECREECR